MVETRSGTETSPYTPEEQAKMAALVKENKERKKREKQAKLKAIADEQATKMKRLEEEMKRVQQGQEERRKATEAEAVAKEEKKRMRIESGEGSSGDTMQWETDTELEKKISEWVANLSLGEDEEAESYKEQLEDQVFVVYVRPVTEAQEKDSSTDLTIAKLLEEFKDLTESPTGVVSRPIQHRIEIEPGSRTPKGAVYRMSPRELEELRKQLDELLEKGWIRPSSSPFGAPVLFVPKKEGELRMCIDYRGLNAITVKNAEPLPRINDLLDRVQGCKYFSKINLKSGYHQIEVHPDDQYKTAFQTRYWHYEFIVMPFGLTNVPATFQRCMNDLFRPWLDKFVVVYLDDILVFSKTLQERQGHLRQVLEKLREANFKINAKKCEWAKTQVLYLGHVLDGDGIKPEDSKIAAIRDWPAPRTLTELRSFLGLANYYRKQEVREELLQYRRSLAPIAEERGNLAMRQRLYVCAQEAKTRIDELAASLATMKEVLDSQHADKEERKTKKLEKLERKMREEEEKQAAQEARQAELRCTKRKEEKLRLEEEKRQTLRKEMLLEISQQMGQLGDSLQKRYEREVKHREKGKQRAVVQSSEDEGYESYDSDVDALSMQTEQLVILEKRKRSADKPIGDSPPMVTPAKRTAKRRLHLGCRHQQMKKTPPRTIQVTGRKKIPAAPGTIGKLRFVTDNLRQLGDLNLEELRRIAASEDVKCKGKKMQTILAITERRTQVAYGEEEAHGEAAHEEGEQQEQVDEDEGDARSKV
ncbi:hypothetical protein CBR_g18943 [Chara braunii]|uniref:Reverse transcriptase domain-containing protein n=1 Tax=Chara braunii TaxID=69332 RepID=A0A388KX49_CHABU|nr:hypothetical protein CBR_g18943 [Chara braunii]|eukprot:GBG74533.1 hypothetical protein CBR_g18943 [Chara braunii]